MFRTSLRSVADPRRRRVCLSCLTQRFGGRPRSLQFYSTSLPLSNNGGNAGIDAKKEDREHLKPPTDSINHFQEQQAKHPSLNNDDKQDATQSQGNAEPAANTPKKPTKNTKGGDSKKPSKGPKSKSSKKKKDNANKLNTGFLYAKNEAVTPLDVETAPVPRLSFGLDRVLFNPGVYHLRDPRSRVYNFDPYLGSIMPVTEFDFDTLKEYITSSKDEILRGVAMKEKKKYIGSSSSMTSVLSHFHYLLSAWREPDTRMVSQGFTDKTRNFTRLLRAPAAMFLRYQDGVYAIDADKEFDSSNILSNLGKSMEKLLTLPKEEFERYRRSSDNKITAEEEQAIPESYHYSTYGDFLMRSQLDAYDPRIPGTGMFDLKTRAVVSIRMDAQNFEGGLGYEIKGRYGLFESYEREFYDMIRSAFLKYSLQVRIGRMDGIFVAFHNIQRIFGFQYISLSEMDQTLHGQPDTTLGDTEFILSLKLWNKILDKVTAKYPKQSIRFHFETRQAPNGPFMYIFAEPMTEEDVDAIQSKNKAEIDAYNRKILNLASEETPEEVKDDSQPSASVSEEPGEVAEKSPEPESDVSEASLNESSTSEPETQKGEEEPKNDPEDETEVMGLALSIKNKVNGQEVERPDGFKKGHRWAVEYQLREMTPKETQKAYKQCQGRREKLVRGNPDEDISVRNEKDHFFRKLRQITERGRSWRDRQNKLDAKEGIVVWGEEKSS